MKVFFYDYELVKKCCKCRNKHLKYSFYQNKTKRDGYRSECKSCCKIINIKKEIDY